MKHPIRYEIVPQGHSSRKFIWQVGWTDHLGQRHYKICGTKTEATKFARTVQRGTELLFDGFSDIYVMWDWKES